MNRDQLQGASAVEVINAKWHITALLITNTATWYEHAITIYSLAMHFSSSQFSKINFKSEEASDIPR